MAKKQSSKHQKDLYSLYKSNQTWKKNREERLKKYISKNPNDEKAKEALKNISYRRRKPINRGVNSGTINIPNKQVTKELPEWKKVLIEGFNLTYPRKKNVRRNVKVSKKGRRKVL